jgi:acyl-CoA thioester hydrolase
LQPIATTISPRFSETDALGHINNASIVAWFEVARTNFLETLADGDASAPKDWVLASVQVDFLDETFYGSDVTAQIVDARVGNSSLTLHAEMFQDGRQTMRGTAVLVHFDPQAKRSKRIPDEHRARIQELHDE